MHETLTNDVAPAVVATVEGISHVLASTKFLCSDVDSISDRLDAISNVINNINIMLQKFQTMVECIENKMNALQESIHDIEQNMASPTVMLAD